MVARKHTNRAEPVIAAVLLILVTGLVIGLTVAIGRTLGDDYQTPQWAIAIHLLTAIPALPLGAYILLSSKGDFTHRTLGKIWAALMLTTAIDTFFIREVTGHIGPIHIFAVVTLTAVPLGIYRIINGDVAAHRRAMLYSYIGLCSAFLFALRPGLRVGNFLFG